MKRSVIILAAMMYSAMGICGSSQDINNTLGLLGKITYKYSGSGSAVTGLNIGNIEFPEATYCDPLSSTPSTQPSNGLVANIFLPSSNTPPNISNVVDFIGKGTKLDGNAFFSNINVPTRSFSTGFTSMTGSKLLDSNGNVLTQNFALEFNSALKLGNTDKEGVYEFALLSDDGARLFAKEQGSNWKELVNNDGRHPTRMACSYNSLTLSKAAEKPIKLMYFQGSGPYLANVLLWRYVKGGKNLSDITARSMCGLSGDNVFYNKTTSAPTAAFKLLEASGWRVIPSSNLSMPEGVTNPCVIESLTITSFVVKSFTGTGATLTWITNIPASSQLQIENVFTGEVLLTTVDSTMVTNHEVQISGLVPGITYSMTAISVDSNGNRVASPVINIP